ncbi:hypothetical protein [Bacillus sp. Marseille-P3661]|uniref:hypothetical protein n=1 Tax=Bacillus sp. Marseille-P3661 TaxID=1936234 RepID=UPI0015E1A4A5|nr:hypothetical protein [Bacillus sp. Marseille-P3661]
MPVRLAVRLAGMLGRALDGTLGPLGTFLRTHFGTLGGILLGHYSGYLHYIHTKREMVVHFKV